MNPVLRAIAMLGLMSVTAAGACATPAAPWKEVASAARYLAPDQLSNAERAIGRLPAADRDAVNAVLASMAAQPPGVAGLTAAGEALNSALPTLGDPNSAVGGDDPAVAAARAGGLAVLQGLARSSGAAVAAGPDAANQAAALLRAVRGLSALDAAGRARVEEELGVGLGGDLFVSALRAVGP